MKYLLIWIFIISTIIYTFAGSYDNKQKIEFNKNLSTLKISAQKGDLKSQIRLAELYATGKNTLLTDSFSKSLYQSAYWYGQASLQGDDYALFKLGQIYEHGYGVKKDLQNANALYYEASIRGHAEAQYSLAQNFEKGIGVPISYNDALYWYVKSAENNYSLAIYRVGVIYDDGLLNVPENNDIALSYFKKLSSSSYDLGGINGRIFRIEHPLNISEQINQQNSNNTNSAYSSHYYGKNDKPTAECWDGTYSYSLGRRGVCSHHGGVRYWF